MNRNKLNWITTESQDDRYLYLTVMRDLKDYCKKGYCEVDITLYRFCGLPNAYIKRMLHVINIRNTNQLIIEWDKTCSVHRLMRIFITILCEVNSLHLNPKAFNEAIEEFCQYIRE